MDFLGGLIGWLGTLLPWVAVALIGASVGSSELIGRYRDAPFRALLNGPGFLYLVVNAAASVAALYMVKAYGWTFGVDGQVHLQLTQVLIAGFGAVALFRSSLFTVRQGATELGNGPSIVLRVILSAADQAVDRRRAASRSPAVGSMMAGVDFAKAKAALPAYCVGLMRNLSDDDQKKFAEQIRALIERTDISDRAKAQLLGLGIANFMGTDVVMAGVTTLGDEIR